MKKCISLVVLLLSSTAFAAPIFENIGVSSCKDRIVITLSDKALASDIYSALESLTTTKYTLGFAGGSTTAQDPIRKGNIYFGVDKASGKLNVYSSMPHNFAMAFLELWMRDLSVQPAVEKVTCGN